jgi:hypothetical protein
VRPRLHPLFVNGLGWRERCAVCMAPPAGPARAYRGPYPITAAVAALAAGNENARLHGLPAGDARR